MIKYCSAVSHTSTGIKVWNDQLTPQDNFKFYRSTSSQNHFGYNFEVTVKLKMTGEKGALAPNVNGVAQFAAGLLDHKFLNEISAFSTQLPTFENILIFVWKTTSKQFPELKIASIKLQPYSTEFFEYDGKELAASQSVKINCTHEHYNPDLSEEENLAIYNKCATPHGHEYTITATVAGPLRPIEQVIIGREEFSTILNQTIVEPFNKTWLNDFVGNTSGEKIALFMFDKLQHKFSTLRLKNVTVRETTKNSFVVGELAN